jgi:hypothetical protein
LRQQQRRSFTQAIGSAGDQYILKFCGRHCFRLPEFPPSIVHSKHPLSSSSFSTARKFDFLHLVFMIPEFIC